MFLEYDEIEKIIEDFFDKYSDRPIIEIKEKHFEFYKNKN